MLSLFTWLPSPPWAYTGLLQGVVYTPGTVTQQDEVVGRKLESWTTLAVHLKMAFLVCSFGLYFRYVVGIVYTLTTCVGVWWWGDWIDNIETRPPGSLKRIHTKWRPPCLLQNHHQIHLLALSEWSACSKFCWSEVSK